MRTRTYFALFVLFAVMFGAMLDATLSFAQEALPTETPPTEVPEAVVVEATEAAPDTGVTINFNNTADEGADEPVLNEGDNEALLGAAVIGLLVVVLGLLILLGVVLRQYPAMMKTAQDSTPPWMDAMIRETLQNIVINPARGVVLKTESMADDELFGYIEKRIHATLDTVLGDISSHPTAAPVPPSPANADEIAAQRRDATTPRS